MRGARLAREIWKDAELADKLERDAADLKRRFNRDYWVEDGEYFALALDPGRAAGRRARVEQRPPALERDRRQVEGEGGRAPSARPAALLGLGRAHARRRARRATTRSGTTREPSGRSTTRSSRGACAATASRTRRPRSPPGILDAAEFFDGRLPEAFGGYPRQPDEVPGAVPDRVQPAGVVDRHAAPAPAHDARARAARRAPRRRSRAPAARSGTSSCSTSPAAGAGSTRSGAVASTSGASRGARLPSYSGTPGPGVALRRDGDRVRLAVAGDDDVVEPLGPKPRRRRGVDGDLDRGRVLGLPRDGDGAGRGGTAGELADLERRHLGRRRSSPSSSVSVVRRVRRGGAARVVGRAVRPRRPAEGRTVEVRDPVIVAPVRFALVRSASERSVSTICASGQVRLR